MLQVSFAVSLWFISRLERVRSGAPRVLLEGSTRLHTSEGQRFLMFFVFALGIALGGPFVLFGSKSRVPKSVLVTGKIDQLRPWGVFLSTHIAMTTTSPGSL